MRRGSPGSVTGGPASTGRPARRWSTRRSTPWRRGRRAATTPTPAARSRQPTRATPCSSRPAGRVAALLGGRRAGIVFGANMTTLTLAFSRAVAATLRPGDRVVGTRLDHDANVTPWRLACDQAGAEHVLAPFDPATGTARPADVIDLIDERTRWVTLPGASNLLGTVPDLAPDRRRRPRRRCPRVRRRRAPRAAPADRRGGARLRRPRQQSPYKWYGPHAGVLCADPALLDELPVAKVRPAPDRGPRQWETGTPSFEAIAAVDAAARFLLDDGLDVVAAAEAKVFAPLLEGCWRCRACACGGRRRWRVARRRSPSRSTAPPRRRRRRARRRAHRHVGRALLRRRGRRPARPRRLGRRRARRRVGYIDDDDVHRLLRRAVARLTLRPATPT